jgi:hypothetical protein
MPDFLEKFADQKDADGQLKFSNWKSGLIVALVFSSLCVFEPLPLTMVVAIYWYLIGCADCCAHFRQMG